MHTIGLFIRQDNTMTSNKQEDSVTGSKPKSGGCLSCLEWLSKKLRLVDDGATPPNWKYIGLVFLALFSSASTLTFLLPFLPEMMLTLGYSESDKGTYVGIVASAVFAGRVVGSVFWGWLADRKGRKVVLLITIALNGLFAGLFGFSTNLVLAVLFRFLCGAANGTVGTAKTVLYDVSDNTNQALSMSMLSLSWGMGMIVGPTVGGFLASPAIKWPDVFSQTGLFGQFPYLLSSLFPFGSCVLIFIVVFFKFDETYVVQSKRSTKEIIVSEGNENESNTAAARESHHPLLGDVNGKNPDSLLQISPSIHSVHTQAATFITSKSTEMEKSNDVVPSVAETKHTDPDVNHLLTSLESSENSMSNVQERYKEINLDMLSETNKKEIDCPERLQYSELRNSNGEHIYHNKVNKSDKNMISLNIPSPGEDTNILSDKKTIYLKNINGNADNSVMGEEKLEENDQFDLLEETVKHAEKDDQICGCVEVVCRLSCCRRSGLFKLLRLSDVWASVMIYTVFSMITIAVEDIFPVFASTTLDYGGLGFSTNEIGFALGAIFLPLLLLQIKLYPYLVSKMGIRKVFLVSAVVCLFTCQLIPLVRLLKNHPIWLWTCLLSVQVPFKIATNCCFAGTSLLINNSVPQELAGQANGLAMMTTAIGRTMAPLLAGVFFSWTVTNGPEIGPPLDTSLPFFVIGTFYFVTIFECLHLNPKLDKQKK